MIQSQYNQTTRMALADAIVDAKARKNLSFEQLNEGTGLSLAFVVAALLGQHPLPADAAKLISDRLNSATKPPACCRPSRFAAASRAVCRPIPPSTGSMKWCRS